LGVIKKDPMGQYIYSDEEFEAYSWCIKNSIRISPIAKDETNWFIEITINNKTNRSPETYKKVVIWEKLFEYYLYYYGKYKNKF